MTLPRLYAVLDAGVAASRGWTIPDLARALLDGGARLIQWRAKQSETRSLLATAELLVRMAAPFGARIVVNDRSDVARLADAAGVHVGQDDLPPAAVRAIVGADAMVGLSTHSTAQIAAAASEPIDYLAVGPVFGTSTKQTGYDAVGLELVGQASRGSPRPVVAIGGITLDTAPQVIAAGAASVAIISDLLTGGDPARRVAEYVSALG